MDQIKDTSEKIFVKEEDEFEESNYRFVIILSFCLLTFCNGMQWVTFSSVGDQFQKYYNLDIFEMNLFSTLYMIAFPIFAFPSTFLIEKNIKLNIIGASSFTLLGAILKYKTNNSLIYAYIGQSLSAIAQPFIANCQAKLSAKWFRSQRVK